MAERKTTKTSVKKSTERKTSTATKTSKHAVKYNNKQHIFAGFLLGLTTGMLFFALYLTMEFVMCII